MERILVAMSGGVDSSVAALLLKEAGHAVVGAYMKNWINEENIFGECPWQQDIEDARAVADRLGMEFRVVNLMEDYRRRIVEYLLDGYRRGITPNPDVMCNREIKFGVFRQYAQQQGFSAVATGHYARRIDHGSEAALYEGADKSKDQSYFLALLQQEQLAQACFPLGHLTKPEVRRLAERHRLPNASKKDSQGICFIGKVRMKDFLQEYLEERPGPIVRADGQEIGRHRGLHYYTVGQRKGIGVPSNTDFKSYVVVGKDLAGNRLMVDFDSPQAPGLYCSEIRVHHLSFTGTPVTAPARLLGRVRYRDAAVPLHFEPLADGAAQIRFDRPQRALASGQILALYQDDRLLGGGVYC